MSTSGGKRRRNNMENRHEHQNYGMRFSSSGRLNNGDISTRSLEGPYRSHLYIGCSPANRKTVLRLRVQLEKRGVICNLRATNGDIKRSIQEGIDTSQKCLLFLTSYYVKDALFKLETSAVVEKSQRFSRNVVIILQSEDLKVIPDMLQKFKVYQFKPEKVNDETFLARFVDTREPMMNLAVAARKRIPGYETARNYFYGFLQLVLPNFKAELLATLKNDLDLVPKTLHKMLIIMPESCCCETKLNLPNQIIFAEKYIVRVVHRAGNNKRDYKSSLYKVIDEERHQEFYFVGEFASPLVMMYESYKHGLSGTTLDQLYEERDGFYHTLKAILSHPDNADCNDQFILLYWSDPETKKPNQLDIFKFLLPVLDKEISLQRQRENDPKNNDVHLLLPNRPSLKTYEPVLFVGSNPSERRQWLVSSGLSSTKLYDLPLEVLDIILQKSFLHWILNSATKRRDKDVISSLILVDVCFNRRITRRRFKKEIWRYLKNFYGRTMKRYTIIRNNRNYLFENIQPNDELLSSLVSFDCITKEQSYFIQRQRSNQKMCYELLRILRPFDDTRFSNFTKCLRRTNQKSVARIIENGGVLLKMQVQTLGAESMETQQLHQRIEYLRSRTKPRSHLTDIFISQLREEGIEILKSQLDGPIVVVWMWCRTQSALKYVQSLYESNQLKEKLSAIINSFIPTMINIDRNQFKKTIVMRPISIIFTQRIEFTKNKYRPITFGVTKLQNEIYVLSRSFNVAPRVGLIRAFEDHPPFSLQRCIEINDIKSSCDMISAEKENCIYISDFVEKCIWRITRKRDDRHEIIKWLATDYEPLGLSVSTDGQLFVVSRSSSLLRIYGSDAELIRSIQLPKDIRDVIQAVETSIGNIIIIHLVEVSSSSLECLTGKWDISELSRDGQMIVRRFIASNEMQELNDRFCISLDSDDQVFVAENDRVILLDSVLRWNRILCTTYEYARDKRICGPLRIFYDEDNRQLIIGDCYGIIVCTSSRE